MGSLAPTHQLHMPGEHQKHSRTLTAWPDRATLPDKQTLEGAERDIAAISNAIAKFEPVTLYCRPRNRARAERLVSSGVEIRALDIDELWIRDTGPVYVRDDSGKQIGLDLNFNYWGRKYKGTIDGDVARSILLDQGIPRVQAPFVAEGGAIETDGEGTLLVTASSIVNDNRNPEMSREGLEEHLKNVLGVSKVIWFEGVRGRDITDAHVDGLARFTAPGKVLLSRPTRHEDKDTQRAYKQAKDVLETATDAHGRSFEVVEMEPGNPKAFKDVDEYQLCLSYVNYLLVNGGVIMPSFGDEVTDRGAFDTIQRLFPRRKVEQVPLTTLARFGGGIHCATQQVPQF